MHPFLRDALHIVAYTAIVLYGPRIVKGLYNLIYVFFLAEEKNLHKLAGGARWAVVTGASEGVGKAYALELAARGFNVLLISRSLEKLTRAKDEILSKWPDVKVQCLSFDFGAALLPDYKKTLFPVIDDLDVGIIVNNVGQMHAFPDALHSLEGGIEHIASLVATNVLPVTLLTTYLLPRMVLRRAGIIVNISSVAGLSEMPKWNVYSATKGYVIHLTRCLVKEYADCGITIQAVTPSFIASSMTHYEPSFSVPDPGRFVASAIRTIGHTSATAGIWVHELVSMGFAFPAFYTDFFVHRISATQKQEILDNRVRRD